METGVFYSDTNPAFVVNDKSNVTYNMGAGGGGDHHYLFDVVVIQDFIR